MKISRKTKSMYILHIHVTFEVSGNAIDQAVSRLLPTRRPGSCGICGGQGVNGAGFLRVL
jgi:uncharacterized membrane protein